MIKTYKTTITKPCWGLTKPFILASSSPRRIRLLENAGFKPQEIVPADIDETEKKGERPDKYVVRVATEKAKHVAKPKQETAEIIFMEQHAQKKGTPDYNAKIDYTNGLKLHEKWWGILAQKALGMKHVDTFKNDKAN